MSDFDTKLFNRLLKKCINFKPSERTSMLSTYIGQPKNCANYLYIMETRGCYCGCLGDENCNPDDPEGQYHSPHFCSP